MRQSPFTGWLETSGPRLTSALRGAWLDLWGGRLSMRVCYAAIPFVIFGTSLVVELWNIQAPRAAAVTILILLLLAVILLSSRGDPSRSEALCSYWGGSRWEVWRPLRSMSGSAPGRDCRGPASAFLPSSS